MFNYWRHLTETKRILESKGIFLDPPHLEKYVISYTAGKMPNHFPVPATRTFNYYLTPLRQGYWWLYWYRMGLNPPRWPARFHSR
jgi:hypothetical protein